MFGSQVENSEFNGNEMYCIKVNEGEVAIGDEVCFTKANYTWEGMQLNFVGNELFTGTIVKSTISQKSKVQSYTVQLSSRKMSITAHQLFKSGLYRKARKSEAERTPAIQINLNKEI